MSLIRKHGAVLQAWACLDLVSASDRASAMRRTDDREMLV